MPDVGSQDHCEATMEMMCGVSLNFQVANYFESNLQIGWLAEFATFVIFVDGTTCRSSSRIL